MLPPLTTFGEAAIFNLEVEVSCFCGHCVAIDGTPDFFRDRRIMASASWARRSCRTMIQPIVAPYRSSPRIDIRKRGCEGMTMGDHSRAMLVRRAMPPPVASDPPVGPRHLRQDRPARRGRPPVVRSLRPAYTIGMVLFDEPPRNRFFERSVERFVCPGCRWPIIMYLDHGPSTPGMEPFKEVA